MSVPASVSAQPTADSERLHGLDAIRGMAILGVLAAYTAWSLGNPPEDTWSAADRLVARGVDMFVDNKFLSLFACLFGLGVSQQWRRWSASGADVTTLHLRRMAFLLLIGLVHAVGVRNGDILAPYALLGFVLLAFRGASRGVLGASALILMITPYAVQAAAGALGVAWPPRPSAADSGYFLENLAWVAYWYETNPFLGWPRILALMLLGLLAGRLSLVERLSSDRRLAVRALALTATLAVLTRLADEWLPAWWDGPPTFARAVAGDALFQVSCWTLAAAYAAALLLALQHPSVLRRSWPLRATGRMAFTNYLVQGLVIVPVCLTFGLFDRVTPGGGLMIAVAVAALQVPFSAWWLRHYSMGPFEALWRRFTYAGRPADAGVKSRA
jgi:uncharacterized protein